MGFFDDLERQLDEGFDRSRRRRILSWMHRWMSRPAWVAFFVTCGYFAYRGNVLGGIVFVLVVTAMVLVTRRWNL